MTYNEQLQEIIRKYRKAGQVWPASTSQIADWAIGVGLWAPHPSAVRRQCADDLARAMREEYITDPQGRRVRAKHVARIAQTDGSQIPLWEDIRTADRHHMEIALQQRRQQIVGDCRQLKIDADSYNQNRNPGSPIQVIFDFTLDVEEMEQAA